MASLITLEQLATWTRTVIAPDDPLALMVVDMASGLVCDEALHEDWEVDVTPPRAARRICLQVAGRVWTNPEMETSYNIGPLGGRVLDWAAFGLTLTPPEEDELQDLRGVAGAGPGGLWIMPIAGVPVVDDTVYVNDQYGMQTIPYLDPNESDIMTPVIL